MVGTAPLSHHAAGSGPTKILRMQILYRELTFRFMMDNIKNSQISVGFFIKKAKECICIVFCLLHTF